jgi:DNA polymerase III subunit epsilon
VILSRLRRRRRSAAARAYVQARPAARSTPWREAAYAVVDLEMTGLDPRHDEIISFASIPIERGRIQAGAVVRGTIRPEQMPAAETIRIHGLRPADLAGAPPLAEALDDIFEALAGRIVVAHPARIERAFLSAALRRAGVRLAQPMICTARLARHTLDFPAEAPEEPSLSDVARRLDLPVHRPHLAEGDALTTAQLFLALAGRLDQGEPQTVGSLAHFTRADGRGH